MQTSSFRRSFIYLTLLLGSAPAQTAPTKEMLTGAGGLYYQGQRATLIRDWCLEKAPSQKTAIQQGFNNWYTTSGLTKVEQYLQTAIPGIVTKTKQTIQTERQSFYTALNKDSKDPIADCKGINTYLTANFNLASLFPAEYQAAQPIIQGKITATSNTPIQSPTPTPPLPVPVSVAEGGSFLQNNRFTPFTKDSVLKMLASMDGKAPYKEGGAFKAGAYICGKTAYYSSIQPSVSTFVLNMFPDGGLVLNGGKIVNRDKTTTPMKVIEGTYSYEPKTGAVNTESRDDFLDDLIPGNGKYSSVVQEEALYNISKVLTDSAGKTFIYAQNGYGSGKMQMYCRHMGAPQNATSPVAKQRQQAAERERIFNLYRTAPGKGLQDSQIEGIIHHYDSSSDGINIHEEESTYLLLKDGSLYFNLRWSPNDLNVAASKKGEPNQWAKWKRQGNQDLMLKNGKWVTIPGSWAQPGAQKDIANSTFQYLSAYTSGTLIGGATSVTKKFLQFSSTDYIQSGGRTVSGSLEGGNKVFGMASSTNPDLVGNYTFKGYTLEFRAKSGQINRTYAYFWGSKKDKLVIAGSTWDRK